MLAIKMAYLNLLRNGRRAFLSMSIMCVSVVALMCIGGFGLYTYESLKESTIRDIGHLTIAKPNYFNEDEDFALQNGLDHSDKITQALLKNQLIKSIQPRLEFTGLVSNGDKTTIFVGTGVQANEFAIKGPFISLKSGKFLSADENDAHPKILLGLELAKNLKVKVGDEITLLTTTSDGNLNGADFQIQGIFSTGVPDLDKRQIYVSLNSAKTLLNSDKVSYLTVFLYDTDNTSSMLSALKTLYPTLGITPWWERAFYFDRVKGLYDRIFIVIGIILSFVVFIAIFNTFTMSVSERIVEIGTLSALGASPKALLKNFLIEAFILAILSSIIGILISAGMTIILLFLNLQMPPPPGHSAGYPLYINFSFYLGFIVFLMITCVCLLASFFAAKRGINKPITEALNYV